MTREDYVRSYNDYIMMHYSAEQAESQKEIDEKKQEQLKERKTASKVPIGQTKEE